MKYLGDSLVGLRYLQSHDTVLFQPTADPTFLYPEFTSQRVFDFLKKNIVILRGVVSYGFWENGQI